MTREEIERRLEEYRAALRSTEPDRWVGMFAEDAEVQDAVGGSAHRGEEQIRAFLTSVKLRRLSLDMTPQTTYVTPPNAAAVLWSLHASQHEGPDQFMEGVSTYDFRQDGKVSRMLVYWSNETRVVAREGRAMNREQMLRWLNGYWDVLRSMDTDRWVDLYTEDATVEDPVGGPVFRGKAELRTFFDGLKRGVRLLDLSPETIFFAPLQTAVHFATRVVPRRGPEFVLRGIVTYAFESTGKVSQMRAYWSL